MSLKNSTRDKNKDLITSSDHSTIGPLNSSDPYFDKIKETKEVV